MSENNGSSTPIVEQRQWDEVTQTILADPDLAAQHVYGNCLQAALASVMRMPLDAVPHFVAFTWYRPALELWLRGYSLTGEWVHTEEVPSGGVSVVAGKSPRSGEHVCIGYDGQIVWDPHPSRAGLLSIYEALIIKPWPTDDKVCWQCGQVQPQRGAEWPLTVAEVEDDPEQPDRDHGVRMLPEWTVQRVSENSGSPTPIVEQVATAIGVIEDSRRTHVEWLTWLEQATGVCAAEGCGADHHADVKIVGDADHHRRCIEGYDLVLRVLREIEAENQRLRSGIEEAAIEFALVVGR
jgi:hypothetical protein